MTLRRENMQRLQIGGFGLIAVMLLVGLATAWWLFLIARVRDRLLR